MFGRRPDGKRIKNQNAMQRMIPLFMRTREGATNYFLATLPCEPMDKFIEQKRAEGIEYTYRDIIIASLVRTFAIRPKFNRFFIGDRLYQRSNIDVAMVAHKSLRTGDEEVSLKARYIGFETIGEIKEKFDLAITNATKGEDKFMSFMDKLPQCVLRGFALALRLFDRFGLVGDKVLYDISPFHSSIFIADLKSIRLNRSIHHLYNFGNCGFFGTIGKEYMAPVVDEETGEVKPAKILEMGISMDERFVDGFYYSHMWKNIKRIMSDLSCLEKPITQDDVFLPNDMKPKVKSKKKNRI